MSDFLRIVEPTGVANVGPNKPAYYSLANTFLASNPAIQSSYSYPTGQIINIPAFPSYGSSGNISQPISYGVNVGEFWKGLSGQIIKNNPQI